MLWIVYFGTIFQVSGSEMTDFAAITITITITINPPHQQPVLPILHHCSAPSSCKMHSCSSAGARWHHLACSQPITSFDYFKQHLLFVHRKTFWLFSLKVFSVAPTACTNTMRSSNLESELSIASVDGSCEGTFWQIVSRMYWTQSECVKQPGTTTERQGNPFTIPSSNWSFWKWSNVCHIVHIDFCPLSFYQTELIEGKRIHLSFVFES